MNVSPTTFIITNLALLRAGSISNTSNIELQLQTNKIKHILLPFGACKVSVGADVLYRHHCPH